MAYLLVGIREKIVEKSPKCSSITNILGVELDDIKEVDFRVLLVKQEI